MRIEQFAYNYFERAGEEEYEWERERDIMWQVMSLLG